MGLSRMKPAFVSFVSVNLTFVRPLVILYAWARLYFLARSHQ